MRQPILHTIVTQGRKAAEGKNAEPNVDPNAKYKIEPNAPTTGVDKEQARDQEIKGQDLDR